MFSVLITDTLLASIAREFKMALNRTQGDAVRHIAAFADREGLTDVRQLAYIIATAYHEARFKPIAEIRAKPGTAVRRMQDRYWHTGYYGRGLCQLTWKRNYQKFQDLLGLPLVENPDLVLDVKVSAEILVVGMLRGLFSGKKLGAYFPPPPADADWLGARKTVNGTFQADRVEYAAKKILVLLYDAAALAAQQTAPA